MCTITDALAALAGAVEALGAVGDPDRLQLADLPTAELLGAIEQVETGRRRLTALAGELAAAADRRDSAQLGGPAFMVVADVARLSRAEARRRIRDATQLLPRTTLTGQTLPPELPATAEAWAAGVLDPEHLRVIQRFIRELPAELHPARVAEAERFLAEKAAQLRPDQLQTVADLLALRLNPDGRFTDEDRARQRGFSWCGRQRPDGMSEGRLIATPELRATIDALLAKFAAPGMCNPAGPGQVEPAVDGEPAPEAAAADPRNFAQRQHDALSALLHGRLGDPKLGRHRGLPVTIIATASVEQLCSAAGHAVTAGGTRLPMSDLIRMASRAWHYLCVYEQHSRRPLYLGRSRRIASPDQRLVLYALDRGCTKPGCDVPANHTEVHHNTEWSRGGRTDVADMSLACEPDHGLITPGGWSTRKRPNGVTAWIPPPHLPHLRGGVNDFHHPERILGDFADPADEE